MNAAFPTGIAKGDAFCNRIQERNELSINIKNGRHTVLLAPRRYGKTSLATEVIRKLNYPHCTIDFLLCGNGAAVREKILEEVGQLLYKLLPKTVKAQKKILDIFEIFRPELFVSAGSIEAGVKLFAPPSRQEQSTICDVLQRLDVAAKTAKKRVVVFMDEFQQIGSLRDQHVIEAALRHAAQEAEYVSYIFSGSDRHMLLQMFNDKSRPFYRLCHTFPIKRIAEEEHIVFIQKQAMKKWKKELSKNAIQSIMELSESHPYYVNLICNYFWAFNEYPTEAKVQAMWHNYVKTQRSVIASDLAKLSNNQKTALKYYAKEITDKPYQKEVLIEIKLSIASLKEAVTKLITKDFLYFDDSSFLRVLDPAIKYFINYDL